MKLKIKWSTAFLALLCFLMGCVTNKEAPSFDAAPVPVAAPDKAILYIYRQYAEPTAWASYLRVDGNEVASLNQQGFTWVYVNPGLHKMQFGWPALAGMPKVPFERAFEAGKVYAFEMLGSAELSGDYFKMVSAVAPIDFAEAQKKMAACCRFVPSKQK